MDSEEKVDQVVVSNRYLDLSIQALSELGLTLAPSAGGGRPNPDPDPDLGLALVTFATGAVERTANEQHPGATRNGSDVPLDRVLELFRDRLKDRYGWCPTIGKNREVKHVDGAHVIGGWDDDQIEDALQSDSNPWPQRADEPGRGVRVGLVDTKLWPSPWLAGGYETTAGSLVQAPTKPGATTPLTLGHATFVAGRILRRAPAATVVLGSVLDKTAKADSWEVAKEIVRVGRSGIRILNMSFGCMTEDHEPPLVLATAVGLLAGEVVMVAAAGNMTTESGQEVGATWPAALDSVLAVGALDVRGEFAADYSPPRPWVDIYAPGTRVSGPFLSNEFNITSVDGRQAIPDSLAPNGFARWSGTSFAAATISGEIAARTKPGHTTAHDARQAVLESSEEFRPSAGNSEIMGRRFWTDE